MMPKTKTLKNVSVGLTAIFPWLWNFYVAPQGYGPEMSPEIAGAMSALIVSIVERIID